MPFFLRETPEPILPSPSFSFISVLNGVEDEELEDEVVDLLIAEILPASSCSSLFFEFFIASISGRFRERISFLLAILFAP